jgi:hypothetical protein
MSAQSSTPRHHEMHDNPLNSQNSPTRHTPVPADAPENCRRAALLLRLGGLPGA